MTNYDESIKLSKAVPKPPPAVPETTVEELYKDSPYYLEVPDYNREIDNEYATEEISLSELQKPIPIPLPAFGIEKILKLRHAGIWILVIVVIMFFVCWFGIPAGLVYLRSLF